MFTQVFISHAKEDYEIAEQLYHHLMENGYSPWLDKKKIKVGEDWDYAINKALKESTFVILLLSSVSVKKRGYVQKEFNLAIKYSKNMLIDDIYIIPILLDNCEVPDHLRKFQWIELNNKNLMPEILDSLNIQRQKYLETLSPDQIELNDFTKLSIDLNIPIQNQINYLCKLPLFHKNRFFDHNFVNTFIQQKALEQISGYRKLINELDDHFVLQNKDNFYLYISHSIAQLNEDFLSLSIVYDSYFGGAHPNTSIDTLNFAFNPERTLRFYDVFKYNYDGLAILIKEWLHKYGDEEQKESLVYYIDCLTEDNINFTFNNKILEINFTNQVPRVLLAISSLEIPLKEFPKNIIKIEKIMN